MDRPASHQGTERPDPKNSEVLERERLARKRAGTKQIRIEPAATIQSIQVMCMRVSRGLQCQCGVPGMLHGPSRALGLQCVADRAARDHPDFDLLPLPIPER